MSDLNKVLRSLEQLKQVNRNEWKARCPCHEDAKPSLSIKYDSDTDKVLLYDHGGCKTEDIVKALGLNMSDLQPDSEKHVPEWWEKNLIDKYDYMLEDGSYLYSKLRYPGSKGEKKEIRYARILNGKYTKGKGDNKSTLYKLPELVRAVRAGETVYYAEGEKDVNTLHSLGLNATTAGGVRDWNPEYAFYFKGADVVLLGDNDNPGRDLVDRVARDLREVAFTVRILYPSEQKHGDVSDYINAGHNRQDLLKLVDDIDENNTQYVTWFDKSHKKINAGLLSSTILKHYRFKIAKHPGTDTYILFIYDHGVYKKISENETVDIIQQYIPDAYLSPTQLKNIYQLIRYGAPSQNFDEINADEQYINCTNGLIDINSGALLKHDPEVFSTIQLNAYYSNADAPLWKQFMNQLCTDYDGNVDIEEVNVIQELSGLIMSNIHGKRLKKAAVFTGADGNTGKTVFLSVEESILGSDAFTATDFRKLNDRWSTGNCFGKRLVAVGDQGGGSINDSSIFKAMTGGDPVQAEFKGSQLFKYTFQGIMVLACNQLPYFSDDKGNHMAERLLLLPCRNVIAEKDRDPYLVDKLLKERDGILTWSMEGLKRFINNGFHFSKCASSEALMEEYRASHDTLYDFITKECELTHDRKDTIHKTDFENAYIAYCNRNELEPLLKKNIKQRAIGLGLQCSVLSGYEVYRMVKFKDLVDAMDDIPF